MGKVKSALNFQRRDESELEIEFASRQPSPARERKDQAVENKVQESSALLHHLIMHKNASLEK